MFGSTVLEVAIGLSLVYLAFSVLCSSIREVIGRRLEERQAGLLQGLLNFFGKQSDTGGWVQKVLESPALAGLASKHGAAPSHIPPREFAIAVLEVVVPGGAATKTVDALRTAIVKVEDPELSAVLLPILDVAGDDLRAVQDGIEARYQNVMTQISAWYRRRTQVILGVIAVVVSLAANLDSLSIADTLYRDAAVRALTVARAAKTTADDLKPSSDPPKDAYARAVKDVESLKLPIGWDHFPASADVTPSKMIGILLTALALMLGGPFWFDILTRASALRTAAVSIREAAAPTRRAD